MQVISSSRTSFKSKNAAKPNTQTQGFINFVFFLLFLYQAAEHRDNEGHLERKSILRKIISIHYIW